MVIVRIIARVVSIVFVIAILMSKNIVTIDINSDRNIATMVNSVRSSDTHNKIIINRRIQINGSIINCEYE